MTVIDGDGPAAPLGRPATPRRRTRLRLGIVGVVLAGALVFLLVEGLGNALDYFDTVHQALAHKSSLGTTTFRLEGVVVKGSIRPTQLGTDFMGSDGDERVPVRNTGAAPGVVPAGIPRGRV